MGADMHEEIRERLMAQYPRTAEAAWRNIELWLSGQPPLVPAEALRDFVANAPIDLLHDSFWRNIPFGTGGVRGTVGVGPNRINPTVVGLTIQAHCDFVDGFLASERGAGYERSVVVANDVRRFLDATGSLKFMTSNPYHALNGQHPVTSRKLAYLAAEVYAANDIDVYLLDPGDDAALLTTPELSFLIRWLKASGGINMSASHNPPDDNGVKVYDENGGQYLPPYDQELTDKASSISHVNHMPFAEAVSKGRIKNVPAEALAAYQQLYLGRARDRGLESRRRTRVVFTPLSGCGGRTVHFGLQELRYEVHVPEREGPDGTFRHIPLMAPNPEVPEATEHAKEEADRVKADLVLATDPDADRLGAEVRHNGEWYHLTGNQIATILAYYLYLDPEGPRLRGGVYQSIVTTLATPAIAQRAGAAHIVADLLVGFKYVGKAIREYQEQLGPAANDEEVLTFAAEESHGYLDSPHLRDKDAMAGALYLARLHERLAGDGRTLVDYLDAVYADVGQFGDRGRAISILGSKGVHAIREAMAKMREHPPTVLGGRPVESMVDYWDEERFEPINSSTDREARNILVFSIADGRVTFRPSGTEPKLKYYVQVAAAPGSTPTAQQQADRLSDAVYQDVLAVLGHSLQPAFAALPDLIPLDSKIELERIVLHELREMLAEEGRSLEFVADWLNERVSAYVPGESALDMAAPAIRSATKSWSSDEVRQIETVLAHRK